MPLVLDTPESMTNTVSTVAITSVVNDLENQRLDVNYIKLLEDGTPFQRAVYSVSGHEDVQALYAELDVLIATGKTFEEASRELLYSKISTGTIV